jgi:hypothetical protein
MTGRVQYRTVKCALSTTCKIHREYAFLLACKLRRITCITHIHANDAYPGFLRQYCYLLSSVFGRAKRLRRIRSDCTVHGWYLSRCKKLRWHSFFTVLVCVCVCVHNIEVSGIRARLHYVSERLLTDILHGRLSLVNNLGRTTQARFYFPYFLQVFSLCERMNGIGIKVCHGVTKLRKEEKLK